MSKPAARGGDPTNHGGTINPASCSKNVFIGGLPAATVASIHNCPMVTPGTPPVPHVGGPVVSPGVPNILINGMPVIGVGDSFFCAGSPPAQVIAGSGNVIFGGGNSINIPSEPRRQRNITKEESAERPPFYIKVELGGEYRDKEVPYSIVDADSDDILEEGTVSHPFEIETTFPDDVRKVRFFIDGEEMDLGSDYSNSRIGSSKHNDDDSLVESQEPDEGKEATVTEDNIEKTSAVKYDPIKAVERLKKNYVPAYGAGKCARYVRYAIEAGMGRERDGENDVNNFPRDAKDFGPDLIKKVGYKKLDFTPSIPNDPNELKLGDIMVFQKPNDKQIHGHIQMWDGEKWGSDFKQPDDDFWAGSSYRTGKPLYEFFRYFTVLIFILVGLVNAQNSNVDKAKNLINTFYKSTIVTYDSEGTVYNYGGLNIDDKKVTSTYFNSEMVELLYSEYKCRTKNGGGMCRDICSFLQECIDYTSKFSITFETKSSNPIRILAKITDSNYSDLKYEILFHFTIENGKPKISDAIVDGLGSLKKHLQSPYPY